MFRFSWNSIRRIATEAELRPTDPAYFTGNSLYYKKLLEMNDLIREHSLDFKATAKSEIQWMSRTSMVNDLSFRMTVEMYSDFKNRLNLLYQVKGKKRLK